jgi:glycine oxidase
VTAPDVLVVGGGVIGLAVARQMAGRGARVSVLERGTPGAEASSAAAGMLSPLAEAAAPGPFLDLLLRARSGFPAFAAELRASTGIDVGYRTEGTLMLALRDEDEHELDERFKWQREQGLEVERLEGAAARELEPAVSPATRWALRFPGDHQVENRLMARALWADAAARGVAIQVGADATRLAHGPRGVEGVMLADGSTLAAGSVVLAGGSWAGRLENLPRPLPVEPVHGQLLSLEALPPPIRHVVDSPRCYLVPRADGRLIVGATAERRGYRKAVTPAGLMQLLQGALEIVPGLESLAVVQTWSGLRPWTPDGLPILGRDPDVRGLFYATGHFRNGILLAPITGQVVAEAVLGESPSIDLDPYLIQRFASPG